MTCSRIRCLTHLLVLTALLVLPVSSVLAASLVDPPEGMTKAVAAPLPAPDPNYDPWAHSYAPPPGRVDEPVYSKSMDVNTWVEDSFADFSDGQFDDSGAKAYVANDGSLQVTNRRDLNRDGFIDVVMCNTDDGDSHFAINSYIFWGTANGLDPLLRTNVPGSGAIDAGVADFNNDGYVDLVITNWLNATGGHDVPSWVYWGSATGYSTSSRSNLSGRAHTGCAIADLNKDGWLDIAIAHFPKYSYTDDFLTIHWGSSTGFNSTTQLNTVGSVGVSIADLNKDGDLDIVVGAEEQTNGAGSLVSSYIFWGSNGTYSNSNKTLLSSTQGAIETSVADLDKDGYLDLVFANHVNLPNVIYWGSSTGYSESSKTTLAASQTTGVSIDDIDGDSNLDIVFCNFNASPSYIFWGSGTRNTWTQTTLAVPSLAFGTAIADYNYDGRKDISYAGFGHNMTFPTYYNDQFRFQSPAVTNLPIVGAHFNISEDLGHVYDRRHNWSYVSSPYDAGSSVSFNTLVWNEFLPPGTDISFRIRTGNTLSELQSAAWQGPNGTDNYNTSPAYLNPMHQGKRWIQYEATLWTDQQKDSPILQRVEIDYSTGTPTPFNTTTPSVTPTPTTPWTPTPASTPVVTNGSFENSLTGWTMWVGSGSNSDPIEQDNLGGGAANGTKVMGVKGFSANGKGAYQYISSGWVTGRYYRISVATKALLNVNMNMSVGFFLGSGGAGDAANAVYGEETVHPTTWAPAYVDFLYNGSNGVTIYLKARNDGSSERAGFDNVVIFDFGSSGATPTPTPTPVIPPGVELEFINYLGGAVEVAKPAPGSYYWKLVDLKSMDPVEGGAKVNVFVKTLNESGTQIGGITWRIFTSAGFMLDVVTNSSGWSDYPMSGGNWNGACPYLNPPNLPPPFPRGPYNVRIMGSSAQWPEITDIVYGVGLPCNHHWSFELIFQKTLATGPAATNTPSGPTPTPTNTTPGAATSTPTPTPTSASTPVVTNPSFESALTGNWTMWTGTGSNSDALERDMPGGVPNGTYCLAIKGIGTGGKGAYQYISAGWMAGRNYRLTVSAKNLFNVNMNYSIGYALGNTGATGGPGATYGTALVHPSSWTQATVDFTYSGSAGVTIYLRAVNDGQNERAGFDVVTITDLGPSAPTSTPTNTPLPTATPTNTPLPTSTPTNTPLPTSTPTNTPTRTPTRTPTPTNTPAGPIAQEDFTSMPSWNSTFNAAWGGAATWSIVSGGQSGNALQATRSNDGSSTVVKVYTVPTGTNINVSVWIKCGSGTGYWAECAYRFGSRTAQDFDQNSGSWTMIKKFANNGTNGNGSTWTQYSVNASTGTNTQITIGYKLGRSGGTAPTVQWDTFRIQ